MDKFPLLRDGKAVGELTVEREALYTWFEVRCRVQGPGLWYAWAVGDQGEVRIGVLEPAGDRAAIRRRFSQRMTAPLGKLLRGEVRSTDGAAEPGGWEAVPAPETLFRTPWLCQQLRGTAGALTRKRGQVRQLALPYDPRASFPLPGLFCFARVTHIQGRLYAVFSFNGEEWPVFAG